jgi:propanediol utilization protein
LGGDTGDPGEPTINEKISIVAPREAMAEIREHAPSTQKTLTVDLLGGDAEDLGASTIKAKNIDGGLPRRQC